MTRTLWVVLLMLVSLLALQTGCEELAISPPDGDQPGDGDSGDGDAPDGDRLPDGEASDGDVLPDGELPADGEESDGDTSDGDGTDDDDPDGDTPDCTSATAGLDCPDSLGCVDGVCAPCTQADHCPSTLGCREGICGPCEEAEECRPGEACRNALCGICTLPIQCRDMEGCRDGLCGPCSEPYDCMGQLCTLGDCVSCADDETCQAQYGEPFACADGWCVRLSCQDDVDCRLQGELCPPETHLCSPCPGTYACLQSVAYGAGYQCLNGRCSEGNCQTDADCPTDAPICAQNTYCRGCQANVYGAHAECRGRFGPDWICTPQGACVIGNCLTTPDCAAINNGLCPTAAPEDGDLENESDAAPAAPYTCRPCVDMAEDMTCRQEYALDNLICSGGACVIGNCHDDSDCEAEGKVCDTENRTCVQCLTQAHCETPEGNERICWNRQCRDCVWGECGEGKVCGAGVCHVGECWIDGEAWADSQQNPTNSCQVCDPSRTPTSWSPRPKGTDCADDPNNPCLDNQCDAAGVCGPTDPPVVYNNTCFIDGVCRSSGFTNPGNECQGCDPTRDKTAWSSKGQGTDCADDPSASCLDRRCNAEGLCAQTNPVSVHGGSCYIGGVCRAGDFTNPGNECQSCQPTVSKTAWTNKLSGLECSDDPNLPCLDRKCDGSGFCAQTNPVTQRNNTCYIGGACYANSATNPSEPQCQYCSVTSSTKSTNWTNKSNGTSCNDNDSNTFSDMCYAGSCGGRWVPSCCNITFCSCVLDRKLNWIWRTSCNTLANYPTAESACNDLSVKACIFPSCPTYSDFSLPSVSDIRTFQSTQYRTTDCTGSGSQTLYVDPAFSQVFGASQIDAGYYWTTTISTHPCNPACLSVLRFSTNPFSMSAASGNVSFRYLCVQKL